MLEFHRPYYGKMLVEAEEVFELAPEPGYNCKLLSEAEQVFELVHEPAW